MRKIIYATVLAVSLSMPALAETGKTEEERSKILQSLQWVTNTKQELPQSHSSINADVKHAVLVGEEAKKFLDNAFGPADNSFVEAVYVPDTGYDVVILESSKDGFVKYDDWDEDNAEDMIESIKEGTTEKNEERKQYGMAPINVIGWQQKPKLDRTKNEATYSIVGESEGQKFYNSVAIIFGRHGYEKLTLVSDNNNLKLLEEAKAAFTFNDGAKYTDYQEGDKIAAYGAGALIASIAGAKLAAKLGFLGIAALFLKKGAFLLIVPIVALRKRITGLFKKKKHAQS